MERNRHKLSGNKSQKAVNEDGYQPLSLENDSRLLPFNDITRIISENEEFNKERQSSTKYRVITTVNSLISNPLFNVTGDDSWSILNEGIFRDRNYPPNGTSINDEEDFTYLEAVDHHLKEENGWFGYYNPKVNESNRFLFTHMKPGKDELSLLTKDGMNWDITYTYPAEKMSNELTQDGLDIIGYRQCEVGGKTMVGFAIAYKHNLKLGDSVRLTGTGVDGDYDVQRVGLDNGDLKENYFVVDAPLRPVDLDGGKFKKIVQGEECEYYFRVFKRVNTVKGGEITNKDYDAFPLAYSKNVFGDPMMQVATKNDIDVNGLTDNLGRPVSEIFMSYIKKPNKGFTKISAGLLVNNIPQLKDRQDIPDIRRIHNGGEEPIKSSTPITDEVKFSDDSFIGDLVEYNHVTLIETILAETHHRFNTTNREVGGEIETILSRDTNLTPIIDNIDDKEVWDGLNPYEKPIIMFAMFSEPSPTNENNRTIDDGLSSGGGFSYEGVYLGYNSDDYDTNCTIINGSLKYIDKDSFVNATKLFDKGDGSVKARTGNYTDGTYIRFWDMDNSVFTTTTNCSGNNVVNETTNPGETSYELTKETVSLGSRQEGYYYKPFHRIKIREFSNYIETGDDKTVNIPTYATKLNDGKFIWRDVMDIGVNGETNSLDYPFLNGSHHLYVDNILSLKRQDPFDEYGLITTGRIGDIRGNKINEKHKINKSGDVC